MGGPTTRGPTVTLVQIAYLLIALSYLFAVIAMALGH